MTKPKYSVRIGNVYFLSRIGLSLRWATEGLAPEELTQDVRHLLARLDQLEAQELTAQETVQGAGAAQGSNPDSDAAG